MRRKIISIRNIKYKKEKGRFLLFAFSLFFTLFISFYLLGRAYARYELKAQIYAGIDKALYIFGDEKLQFNLEPDAIIPRDEPYVYRFSVSNFNSTKQSDVDLSYNVKVRTTTNLPITIQMYRNELWNASGATNIFGGAVSKQDRDGAWYRVYESVSSYEMDYVDQVTDAYTLVITFPTSYADDPVYANYLESIEVTLESKQII